MLMSFSFFFHGKNFLPARRHPPQSRPSITFCLPFLSFSAAPIPSPSDGTAPPFHRTSQLTPALLPSLPILGAPPLSFPCSPPLPGAAPQSPPHPCSCSPTRAPIPSPGAPPPPRQREGPRRATHRAAACRAARGSARGRGVTARGSGGSRCAGGGEPREERHEEPRGPADPGVLEEWGAAIDTWVDRVLELIGSGKFRELVMPYRWGLLQQLLRSQPVVSKNPIHYAGGLAALKVF